MSLERTTDPSGQSRRIRRGLIYRTGPFIVRLQSPIRGLAHRFSEFYGTTEIEDPDQLAHFSVRVADQDRVPYPFRRRCNFSLDAITPFAPYPYTHAFPLLEWGLNWCIGTRAHKYLMLHCGAVEHDGQALLLPAMPGSGKSTLSAALAYRGWRLLTDEIGIVVPGAEAIHPLPRAIPLKNTSIEVFKRFEPSAFVGPIYEKTRKGDVAHVRPPQESLDRQRETAAPAWIVFPRFTSGRSPTLRKLAHGETFVRLTQNSFNYRLLGERGFREAVRLVRQSSCYSIEYGSLDDALGLIEEVVARK